MVDDFPDWRRWIVEKLSENPALQVIGVAVDGLEAVQKSEELRPDLVLLDIGMPRLDGISCAPEIRKVSAKSKILFLTQEMDPQVAKSCFEAGGDGFVVKSSARLDLFPAILAVMLGDKFISPKVCGSLVQ